MSGRISIHNHPLITDESWEHYTKEEHARWAFLYRRQKEILKNRAADEVLDGMKKLGIDEHQIPKFSDLNKVLKKNTGFSIVPVKSLIPDDLFFTLLADRKFPGTCFIRTEEQLDYLQEPDVFHELFGHLPLLVHPVFANFMEAYGKLALEGLNRGYEKFMSTIYWFTVEFGLIQTSKGLRIYGAGITSSMSESVYSIESNVPVRVWLNPLRTMRTRYRIDDFQKTYFVIRNYDELFSLIQKINLKDLDAIKDEPEIGEGVVVNREELI